jgi:hypothetical protein
MSCRVLEQLKIEDKKFGEQVKFRCSILFLVGLREKTDTGKAGQ